MRGMVRLLAAAAMGASLAGGAQAETLADALVGAYENSNLLEQNRAVLRAADEDVASAVAALRPAVSFATSFTGQQSTTGAHTLSASIGLTGDLTLYDFGRGQLGIEAAKEAVLATRQALIGVEQNVLLSAVAAYIDVRSAIDTVSLRQNNVRLIQQELGAAQDRFEVGEITRTDVAIAEARLAASRSNLAVAEGDLAVARETYRAAVGRYPGALQPPPPAPQLPASLDAAQGIARTTHPSIRQSQHEVAAVDLNVERAARARQGTIGARAEIGGSVRDSSGGQPGADDPVGNVTASVTYSRPLYQGGGLSSAHRQAIAQRDRTRAALHQTVVQVLQNTGQSWAQLQVARAGIEASLLQIEAAETAYEGVRQEAELGARTTLDVLNAEQELLDARAARINAEAQRYVAVYSVLSSMGLLTVEHLNLGIPTYDPAAYYNAVSNAPVTSPQGEALERVLRTIGRP